MPYPSGKYKWIGPKGNRRRVLTDHWKRAEELLNGLEAGNPLSEPLQEVPSSIAAKDANEYVQNPAKGRTQSINEHGGKKYLRNIVSAVDTETTIQVDVYAVIRAFDITNPAQQHAAKKVLCAGQRGKGSVVEDLAGAIDALHRAIELEG